LVEFNHKVLYVTRDHMRCCQELVTSATLNVHMPITLQGNTDHLPLNYPTR